MMDGTYNTQERKAMCMHNSQGKRNDIIKKSRPRLKTILKAT